MKVGIESMKSIWFTLIFEVFSVFNESQAQPVPIGCFKPETIKGSIALPPVINARGENASRKTLMSLYSSSESYTLQGKFLPPVGYSSGGRVVCFDSLTLEVVAVGDVYANGEYKLSVPRGTYGLYVNPVGIGPNLFLGIEVYANLTKDFLMSVSDPQPIQLQSYSVSPLFIFNNNVDSTTLRIALSGIHPDSLFLVNEYASFSMQGKSKFAYRMADDGTHDDGSAGDNFYALGGLTTDMNLPYRNNRIGQSYFWYVLIYQGGQLSFGKFPNTIRVGIVQASESPSTVALSTDVQRTTRVVNIAAHAGDLTVDSSPFYAAMRRFYDFFPDFFDFFQVFYLGRKDGLSFSGSHGIVKTEPIGVGLPQYIGDEQRIGSAGYLKGVSYFPDMTDPDPPLWHETAHQWANFLPGLFDGTTHWGWSDVDGVLGGFKRGTLSALGGNEYSVDGLATNGWKGDGARRYADLELYLAGLLPPDSLTYEYNVAKNPTGSSTFHADSMAHIGVGRIIAQYGDRKPVSSEAQRKFKSAFLVITDSLLGTAGLAFYDVLAETFGDDAPASEYSFRQATGGRAEMITLLDNLPLVTLAEAVTQSPERGAIVHDFGVSLRWASVPYSASYEVEQSTDSSFTKPNLIQSATSMGPSFTWLANAEGYQFWRVRAKNASGWGPWSKISTFQITFPSIAPVTLVSPQAGEAVTSNPIAFSWNPIPLTGMRYRFQLCRDSSFQHCVVDTLVGSLTFQLDTSGLVQQSRYWWRVQGVALSRIGSFSTSQSIWLGQAIVQVPDVPNLMWGDVGAVEQTPLLIWFPSPRAESYQIQVAGNSEFTNPFVDSSNVTQTWFLDEDGRVGSTHYFRVRAFNRTGASDWSATSSYIPQASGATLLEPANHSIVGSQQIVFRWSRASFPSGFATKYYLWLRVNPTNLTGYYLPVSDTSFVYSLDAGIRLYWGVVAFDPSNASVNRLIGYWTFSTKPLPPARVALISPPNGGWVRADSTLLRWSHSDTNARFFWLKVYDVKVGKSVYGDSTLVDTLTILTGLQANKEYTWSVRAGNGIDWGDSSQSWTFRTSMSSVAEPVPLTFALDQNFPNPFNPSTTIRYGLPNRSHVKLTVFNTLGQQVTPLQNGEQEAGYHDVKFDGSGLSSGVYFYRIQAGSFVETKKLLLVR
jgi:hypothetical protein